MAKRTGRYHDWGKTYKAFSYALLNAGNALASDTKRDMAILSREFLGELDAEWPHRTTITRIGWGKNNVSNRTFGGDRNHPWYTGQLHDSVAVRVAEKNKTVSVEYMNPSAGDAQHMSASDGMKIDHIIGADWGRQVATGKAPYYFLPGIQVQLIVGVPYAEKVNESDRHAGFMGALSVDLINKVDAWIEAGGLTRRNYLADDKTAISTHRRFR